MQCRRVANTEDKGVAGYFGVIVRVGKRGHNEPSKNKHYLILLSSLARNSQEPKSKRIFEIP